MKKNISKVVLAALIASAPLVASEYSYNVNSLFAIEGNYNSFDVESAGGLGTSTTKEFGGLGLKVGAETKNYRAFVGARGFSISDFSYAYTYGIDLQYKFNFSEAANFYLGVNGGMADMKIKAINGNPSETISEGYAGGDLGFNFHASDMIDLELGARVIKIKNYDNMASGYASIIIKYQMD